VNTAAITRRAHTIKLSVVLLWLVTGVFHGPGWVAGRVWFCIAWAGCAVAEGFTAGANPPTGPPG
jgi:hypothetical protein